MFWYVPDDTTDMTTNVTAPHGSENDTGRIGLSLLGPG